MFTTNEARPKGFDLDAQQHLISLNTADNGQPDEYQPPTDLGPHFYASHGIYVMSQFVDISDVIHDGCVLNISYVHKNDYAGAYDSLDCWRGNRWRNACGREGLPYLENYGSYPDRDVVEEDVPAGDTTDDPGINTTATATADAPPTDGVAVDTSRGGDLKYAKITDHSGGRLTDDIFKQIEAYPIPSSQDTDNLI